MSASHSTSNGSPAFLFYVAEWRSSRAVQRMTFAQRGMYFEMLCEQWDKGSLPDCPRACADALGGTDEEWLAAWPTLRRKFVDRRSRPRPGNLEVHDPTDCDPVRQLVNLRLERVRQARQAYVNSKKTAGREGGHSKAQKRKELEASTPLAEPSTPLAEPSTPLAPPLAKPSFHFKGKGEEGKDLISEGSGRENVPPARASARSKHPTFSGQRFVVFEWMLDDLHKLLGTQNFEAFDLHEWFAALDARAEQSGIVIPQRDGGKWLQEQTLAEASRRGLLIAAVQPGTGKTAGNAAAIARFVARGQA